MSPNLQHFDDVAKGRIPSAGVVSEASVAGRKIGAYDILAEHLGRGIGNGRVDVSQIAIAVRAAPVEKITPGGGLNPTGDETVRYKPNTEEMFFNNHIA